jgi:hypothetical protein
VIFRGLTAYLIPANVLRLVSSGVGKLLAVSGLWICGIIVRGGWSCFAPGRVEQKDAGFHRCDTQQQTPCWRWSAGGDGVCRISRAGDEERDGYGGHQQKDDGDRFDEGRLEYQAGTEGRTNIRKITALRSMSC